MNDEHYIDGEHNGGVENSFNHASYSYCYQNPILYTDPNGKQSVSNWVHGGLDVIGLVPGFGEAADGINAIYYASEGDFVNAGLSAAAMIPLAGYAASAAKFARKAEKAVDAIKAADKSMDAIKTIDKAVDVKKAVKKAEDISEGVIYKRVDKTGKQKDYIGQAKNSDRYKARQKEHQRANKDADYEFIQIDKGRAGKDLDIKEQKHLDKLGGPTNKSNPNDGTSNKKNVIKKK